MAFEFKIKYQKLKIKTTYQNAKTPHHPHGKATEHTGKKQKLHEKQKKHEMVCTV